MKSIKLAFLAMIVALAAMAWSPLTAPSVPAIKTPASKALLSINIASNGIKFQWSKSLPSTGKTVTRYIIQISERSDFATSVLPATNVTATTSTTQYYVLAPGSLPSYAKTYYWRIRAYDGTYSSWATSTFRVGVEPPSALAVADAAEKTLRPVVSWTPGANLNEKYTIQWSVDCAFSTYKSISVYATSVPLNEYTLSSDLLPGTEYCWRMRAENATLGASQWTPVGTTEVSYTSVTPPTIPVLVSPSNGSYVNNATPNLTWKSVISGEGPGSYQIQVFDTSAVKTATPLIDVTVADEATLGDFATTLYSILPADAFSPQTTYYWRMRAYDVGDEYSAWSALRNFYVGFTEVIDPANMNPSVTYGNVPGLDDPANASSLKMITGYADTHDNVNLLSLRPKFQWGGGVTGADDYHIQIAKAPNCNLAAPASSNFTTPYLDVTVPSSASAYTPSKDLPPNNVMCWRVRPKSDIYGYGKWSEAQIFLTANPPSTPVTAAPINNTLTNDTSPDLDWKISLEELVADVNTEFAKYEVEISFKSNFSDRNYPDNAVPPYNDVAALTYPVPPPDAPDSAVGDPVLPVLPPDALCNLYPSVHQAFDPADGTTNRFGETHYQLSDEAQAVIDKYGPLCGARTYSWRVRAYNSNGEYSAWSDIRSVRIYVDRPTNLRVTNCGGVEISYPTSNRPCIEWDKVYGAVRYSVQVSQYPNFSSYFINTATTTNKFQMTKPLPPTDWFYVRIYSVSQNYGYQSLRSDTLTFKSANPPSIPVVVSPAGGILWQSTAINLDWKPSAFTVREAGEAFGEYQIRVATASNFNTGSMVFSDVTATGDINDTIFSAAPLDRMKTYYWSVRACNNKAPLPVCSSWTPARSFRVAVEKPQNLAVNPALPRQPLLSWDAVPGATSYETVASTSATSCSTSYVGWKGSTTGLSWKPAWSLKTGTKFYLCVRAKKSTYGPGLWAKYEYIVP